MALYLFLIQVRHIALMDTRPIKPLHYSNYILYYNLGYPVGTATFHNNSSRRGLLV